MQKLRILSLAKEPGRPRLTTWDFLGLQRPRKCHIFFLLVISTNMGGEIKYEVEVLKGYDVE